MELTAIWRATSDSSDYSAVVRLLALTAARASEIAGLRWSWIVGDQIVLPSESTKNGREHVIPITEPIAGILAGRPRRGERDLIFGRRWNRPLTGWSVLKASLDKRLGTAVADFRHHDLRRTAATNMSELGIAPHIVAAVLNHVSEFRGGVHGVYDRSTLEPQKRHALVTWGERLLAIVEGRAVPDKVVQLRA